MSNKEFWNKFYNKGNDCDSCENQYLYGRDGDAFGCRCYEEGEECNYSELAENE